MAQVFKISDGSSFQLTLAHCCCCCPTKEGAGVRKEDWFLINLALDSFIMCASLDLLASLHLFDLMSGVIPLVRRSLIEPRVVHIQ